MEGVQDLQRDPLIRWQHRYHFWIGAAVALIPVYVGLATGNVWGHLVMGLLLRIVLTHHSTFLINSAAHRWGTQPYSDANSARDNGLLAPLTFGEGYHNFHHMWQWDYRNAARWYQWDPGKWLISAFAWVGLAKGLRRTPETDIRKARVAMEAKRLASILAGASPGLADGLVERLNRAKGRMDQALGSLQAHREAWAARKVEWKRRGEAKGPDWRRFCREWKADRARCQRDLREAWSAWKATRMQVRDIRCV
jgi:stearoyl-CoA desaturase (delta-9 desaturase)